MLKEFLLSSLCLSIFLHHLKQTSLEVSNITLKENVIKYQQGMKKLIKNPKTKDLSCKLDKIVQIDK